MQCDEVLEFIDMPKDVASFYSHQLSELEKADFAKTLARFLCCCAEVEWKGYARHLTIEEVCVLRNWVGGAADAAIHFIYKNIYFTVEKTGGNVPFRITHIGRTS